MKCVSERLYFKAENCMQQIFNNNLTLVYRMGGIKLPPDHYFAAISASLGISGRAFATFPEYELATGWRFQTIFDTFQESNMAAGKPENAWKSA